MTDNSKDRTGSCLCGGVKFTVHGDVKETDICHCGMCRRQNGGGPYYATQFKGGVTIDPSKTLKWYKGSEHGERGFCDQCGASVMWRLQAFPDKVGVSLGALDDTSGIKPEAHIFTDSGPDYYAIPKDIPNKTGAEVMAEFMAKMQKGAS